MMHNIPHQDPGVDLLTILINYIPPPPHSPSPQVRFAKSLKNPRSPKLAKSVKTLPFFTNLAGSMIASYDVVP